MRVNEVLSFHVTEHQEPVGKATLEIDMYEHGGVLRAEDQPVFFVQVDSDDVEQFYGIIPHLAGMLRFDDDHQCWGMYVIGLNPRGGRRQ